MGALVHGMYPTPIVSGGKQCAMLSWQDFKGTGFSGGQSTTTRVLEEFWWRFKCAPEHRYKVDRSLEINFKRRVNQMLHEEKKSVIKKFYENGKVPEEDIDEEGNHWPTKEGLIAGKPVDFATPEGWCLLCEHWSTPSFRKKSLLGKRNRLAGGDGAVYHRNGSRSLPSTRQFLTNKTGVDPGLAGAWLYTHTMHPGTNDGILCSQSALDKWEHYGQGMEDKYGPNWQAGQLKLDASVIYDNAGRKPHGRLRIGDEAISPEKKEAIMSRKRNVHPPTFSCSRMVRLQRENEHLRGENTCLRGLERVVQALAAKGGEDFDALHMVVFDVMNGSYLAPGYFEDVGMEPK